MRKDVYISTGSKQVMHTLWVHKDNRELLDSMMRTGSTMAFNPDSYKYIKNLPDDEQVAIDEAKAYAEKIGAEFIGIINSPNNDRVKSFDFAGSHFVSRMKNGKSYFVALATSGFWQEWNKSKEDMKQKGFRVSKFDRDQRWYVIFDGVPVEKADGGHHNEVRA